MASKLPLLALLIAVTCLSQFYRVQLPVGLMVGSLACFLAPDNASG
jgi:hypothetical protein